MLVAAQTAGLGQQHCQCHRCCRRRRHGRRCWCCWWHSRRSIRRVAVAAGVPLLGEIRLAARIRLQDCSWASSSWCWVLRRGAWETAVSCGRVAWTAPRRAMWIRDIRCAWRSGAHVVHCLGRASRVVLGGALGRPDGSAGALASKGAVRRPVGGGTACPALTRSRASTLVLSHCCRACRVGRHSGERRARRTRGVRHLRRRPKRVRLHQVCGAVLTRAQLHQACTAATRGDRENSKFAQPYTPFRAMLLGHGHRRRRAHGYAVVVKPCACRVWYVRLFVA